MSPLKIYDVKMKIRSSLCKVQEHMAKPNPLQNADTGVFSLGDIWRVFGTKEIHVLREDRPLY
jgi:hypothetical protein